MNFSIFRYLIGFAFLLLLTGCDSSLNGERHEYKIPKVLFITTGDINHAGNIPQGAILAVQTFNKNGAYVRLEARDILLKPEDMKPYTIIIMLSAINYHDADRRYSLTYLSDMELDNIRDWIRNGGYLVAGDNIGRNTNDGLDRTTITGELTRETWKLSEVFGIDMKERNIQGFELKGNLPELWNETIKQRSTQTDQEDWALTVSGIISDKVKVLAEWDNGTEKIPSMIENEFGNGKALLLPTSYMLHPANDGGISSAESIERFYEYVLNSSLSKRKFKIELNPWINGYSSAFCISFNSAGEPHHFNNVINFLKGEDVPATFFLDSSVNAESLNILEQYEKINFQSNSFERVDFKELDYSQSENQILMNQNYWKRNFTGFRFPFTKTNFWGLYAASKNGYIYDSSIGVDYLTSFSGSVFPYNIPIAGDIFYQVLDMFELSPVLHDDYFFYERSLTEKEYTEEMQYIDSEIYAAYLMNFFTYAIERNNGLMVYMGHPFYSGISDITLSPLSGLVNRLKNENCWITSLENVAEFRMKLNKLSITVIEFDNGVELKISLPDDIAIEGVTLKLDSKPTKIEMEQEKTVTKEIDGKHFIQFDARDGLVLKLYY